MGQLHQLALRQLVLVNTSQVTVQDAPVTHLVPLHQPGWQPYPQPLELPPNDVFSQPSALPSQPHKLSHAIVPRSLLSLPPDQELIQRDQGGVGGLLGPL